MPRHPSSISAQRTQPVRVQQVPAAPQRPVMPAQRRPVRTAPPARVPAAQPRALPPRRQPARKSRINWWIAGPLIGVLLMIVASVGAVLLGVGMMYAGGILPGVHAAGVALGGMSQPEAAAALQAGWDTITLRDGSRAWDFNPAMFGITLDADATARAAYAQGRSEFGAALRGLLGRVDVPPVIQVDTAAAAANLQEFASQFELPPVDAGVQLVNGHVEATPPVNGRMLDVTATVEQLARNGGRTLADGELDLVMQSVAPTVTDSTPIVEAASHLLSNPFDVRVYDPATGDSVYWSVPPEQWGGWLTAASASRTPTGLSLAVRRDPVYDYINAQANAVLDSTRYINTDQAVESVQEAVTAGQTDRKSVV